MSNSKKSSFTRLLRKSADWLDGLLLPSKLRPGQFTSKSHEWRPLTSVGAGPHTFSFDLTSGDYHVLFSLALSKAGGLPVPTSFHEKAPLLRVRLRGGAGKYEAHVPISGFTEDGRVFGQLLKYWVPLAFPLSLPSGGQITGEIQVDCVSAAGEVLPLPYIPLLSGPRAVRRPTGDRKLVIAYVMESWSGNPSLVGDSLPSDLRQLWDRCFEGFEYRPRMVAQSDWTLPATVSCLTGRLPSQHGLFHSARMRNGVDRLSEATPTLPSVLREHGFVCLLGLLGKANFETGFAGGFDYCYKPEPSLGYSEPMPDSAWAVQQLEYYQGLDTFLYLHHDILHSPYIAFTGPWSRNNPLTVDIPRNGIGDSEAKVAYLRNLRLSLLRFESLLAYLRATGQLDQAQILVLGDHGPDLPPWDRVKHSHPLHQMRLRVPYFVKWPAWREKANLGVTESEGYGNSSVQVSRDVLSALGAADRDMFAGLPQFREELAGVGIAESIATPVSSSRDDYVVSLIKGGHKYVAFWKTDKTEFRPLRRYRELLFASVNGPEEFDEENDLSGERPETVREFRKIVQMLRPECAE